METKIKVYRIFSWIMTAISSAIVLVIWGYIVKGFINGGSEGASAVLLCFLAVPGIIVDVVSIVLLVLCGKSKNPHQGILIGEMLVSIGGLSWSYFLLGLLLDEYDEAWEAASVPFLIMVVVKLILSIIAIVATKRLRRQAKAQQQAVQPVQQYQQPVQPAQPVQQYQQPVQVAQPVQQYQQPQQ